MDWFKSERQKWATPIDLAQLGSTPTLPGFDALSRELYGTALPRGVLLPRLEPDRERVNYWMSPTELMKHRFQLGQIILGKLAGTYLGHLDDRPMVTIAGLPRSRSRRSVTTRTSLRLREHSKRPHAVAATLAERNEHTRRAVQSYVSGRWLS